MDKPLSGSMVLVTRPPHQANTLRQLIEKKGAEVILFPTIIIKPPHNQSSLQRSIDQLDQYDIAIFVSANAVNVATKGWSNKTLSLKTIAIGTGSANALQNNNIPVDFIPKKFNSEGVLALPLLNEIKNKSIVIFCGENPRPLLKEQLQTRGAHVDQAICYRRECPASNTVELQQLTSQSFDSIISTSQESLRNLVKLFTGDWIYQQRLLVISPSMAELAHELGFTQQAVIAENATDQAIVEALLTSLH